MNKSTSIDVAKLAKVSQSTVSAVLSNSTRIKVSPETRKRVLDAAKELQYGPFIRQGGDKCPKLVAVFVPTLSNPFYPQLVSIIESILYSQNICMIVCCTDKDPDKEYNQLTSLNASGIIGIIFAFTPSHYQLLLQMSGQTPTVIIGETDSDEITTVALDSKRAGYLAAKYLYNLGHRRIAFISEDINTVSLSRKRRLEGILQFIQEASDMHDLIVYAGEADEQTTDDIRIGYLLAKRLLCEREREATAIIGVNDYTAIGILNATRELGLSSPGDISIMGFDNIEMSANVSPSLTTIDHIINERCQQAVDILMHGSSTNRITYNPMLIERESTGRI